MTARLSVIIPTHDGDGLERCLASIERQPLRDGDEVLVVGDTYDGPLFATEALTLQFGHQFRFLRLNAGRHAWGHPQINYGIRQACGDYLLFQDDDDIYLDGAFDRIHKAVDEYPEPVPLMFRWHSYRHGPLWVRAEVACGNVGGHAFVVPNIPHRLGTWSDRYEGDFDFILSTLELWPPGSLHWRHEVIAHAQPPPDLSPLVPLPVETPNQIERLRLIRNECAPWMTRHPHSISSFQQTVWWAGRPDTTRVWLYYKGNEAVGFGMLRREGERTVVTVGVAQAWRGQGIGTDIYRHLIRQADGPVHAEIRADNEASIRACLAAGFTQVAVSADLLLFSTGGEA